MNAELMLATAAVLAMATCVSFAGQNGGRREGDVLAGLRAGHPRLLLTDERLADLKARAETDEVLAQAVADVLADADRHMKRRRPVYKKIGPRLLRVSRDVLDRVYALGLAWRWTGQERYARRLTADLKAVCAFEDWNPSHFLDTAEMAHAVGVGYDWLHDDLSEADRVAIRRRLVRLGLEPGRRGHRRKAWWTRNDFNWNQVCNGGLAIGALAVAEDEGQRARYLVGRAVELLPIALATYDPDGAWPEGPGYWSYATRYTAYALSAMETALGTDFGLGDGKGLAETALFPLHLVGPTDLLFNYADDGEPARLGPRPELLYLAHRHNLPAPARLERRLLGQHGARAHDVIWYLPAPTDRSTPVRDRRFRGRVPVAVFRSAWDDPNALFLGIKGGDNQANHGHLDLGSFVFDARGVRWACELGRDNYNLPGYWQGDTSAGRRWTYYRLNSLSHNLVLLDGANQDVHAKAEMIAFRSTPAGGRAVIDLTEAYRPKASRALRGAALLGGRRAVEIRDELTLAEPAEVTWGMTTRAKIDIAGPVATLTQAGQSLTARILAPTGATFATASAHRKPPENPNRGYRRLTVPLGTRQGQVTLRILLAPADVDVRTPPDKPLTKW